MMNIGVVVRLRIILIGRRDGDQEDRVEF